MTDTPTSPAGEHLPGLRLALAALDEAISRAPLWEVPVLEKPRQRLLRLLEVGQNAALSQPLPYNGRPGHAPGSETSRQAAEDSRPRIRHRHELILQALEQYGPLTDWELTDVLRAWGQRVVKDGVAPLRCYLKKWGLVVDSGKRRPSPEGGRPATAWQLAGAVVS